MYKYGENPDVLIFQKVYCNTDYKFPANFKGIKILDLCDPDWIDGAPIKETVDAVDAVTCSSQAIADFITQLTDKPVLHIPDRFDLTVIPPIKKHTQRAKRIIWFGYRHNADLLKPLIKYLPELDVELLVVSNDDPLVWSYHEASKPYVKYKKYQEETIYGYLKSSDFAVFPNGARPNDRFKSNNKTVKAILAGLPVATTIDEVRAYLEPEARQKYIDTKYGIIYKEYDVKNSVKEYKELISNITKGKLL